MLICLRGARRGPCVWERGLAASLGTGGACL